MKDSHDRYANIEINYLLQRLESYRGLAILATNMKSALDTAFLRRLRFVVNFPFPGIADRRRLWEKAFLQQDAARDLSAPPLDSLDYDRLARLNLTGGHIHNVALNAFFPGAKPTPVESKNYPWSGTRRARVQKPRSPPPSKQVPRPTPGGPPFFCPRERPAPAPLV